VAWVDFAARSNRFGRAVLIRGNHARSEQLPADYDSGLERLADGSRIAVPGWLSASPLLRSPFPLFFNELYFRRARDHEGSIKALTGFFYPLDVVNNWNELYGRGGFLQYQFVLPFGAEETLKAVVRQVASAGRPLLAVLKQFGPSAGPLSFPIPGWTVTLDLQLPAPELGRALDRADESIAAAGGRVYLAKDSRLRRQLLPEMYPGLDDWREVQAELDPAERMHSDLARRLDVTGGRSA
jgi:decaprenylphospho-beta-D-ribofuranose 2-oxidase